MHVLDAYKTMKRAGTALFTAVDRASRRRMCIALSKRPPGNSTLRIGANRRHVDEVAGREARTATRRERRAAHRDDREKVLKRVFQVPARKQTKQSNKTSATKQETAGTFRDLT